MGKAIALLVIWGEKGDRTFGKKGDRFTKQTKTQTISTS
jgi:hypothetical protein